MSGESITSSISSGLRFIGGTLRGVFSGLLNRDDRAEEGRASTDASPAAVPLDENLLLKASREILAYTRQNQPLLDRAERYSSRAKRLFENGTTSESAANKAERARQEILAGLAALRASFVERNDANTEKAEAAFDHESRNIFSGSTAG